MRTSLSSAKIIKYPSSSFIFPFYSPMLAIGAEAWIGAPPTVCRGVDPVLPRKEREQGQAAVTARADSVPAALGGEQVQAPRPCAFSWLSRRR